VLSRYVDDKIIFVDNYQYTRPSQIFSTKSSMLRDNKLIISGTGTPDVAKANAGDILQRLIYTLRLKQQTEPSIVYDRENINSLQYYYKRLLINSYYTTTSDFTKHADEIIFPTTFALQSWIQQQTQDIHLFNKIEQDISFPYLLQSPKLTNNQIVLCHNTNNLTKAYNIAVIWYQQKFNPIEPITEMLPLGPFTLILPDGGDGAGAGGDGGLPKIIKIDTDTDGIVDNNLSIPINIVGYLVEGTKTQQYTVLLFL